jgi:2-polyprenyl-6-methoxyphenol hydroxylase-like FAD-dependent oxidoreductase
MISTARPLPCENDRVLKAIVVGGGIGGLATALSLHELGAEVHVYEAVDPIRPLGVGINLLPHAVRELEALGLAQVLEASGVATSELAFYSKHGKPIWREPRGREAGYRWPQISIHRGHLHMLLLETTQERLGTERVHLGHKLTRFETNTEGAVAHFVDRRTGAELPPARGDVLIAADGIHSAARAQLYPNEGPPKWNGAVMWRGVSYGEPFLSGRSMIMAGHLRHKFVAYPIGKGEAGKPLINWVAELRFDSTDLSEREDWNKPGKLEEFLPSFKPWKFDWLDVPALIESGHSIYEYPMVDRDPLPSWSDGSGRMTLLGDAAHPMYPIGSNGASQAILDARVLAGCLKSHPCDVARALTAYEAVRRPATSAVVLANREQGPEHCLTVVEDRAPNGFERLEDVIAYEELKEIADTYKRIAGFSIDALNSSPSLADREYP